MSVSTSGLPLDCWDGVLLKLGERYAEDETVVWLLDRCPLFGVSGSRCNMRASILVVVRPDGAPSCGGFARSVVS